MKQVATGRKNWLFIGTADAGERAANLMTLVSTAHRNDLDVWMYLKDALDQLLAGSTDYESLRADVWKQSHPEAVRTYRSDERRDTADRNRLTRAQRRLANAKKLEAARLAAKTTKAEQQKTKPNNARPSARLHTQGSPRTGMVLEVRFRSFRGIAWQNYSNDFPACLRVLALKAYPKSKSEEGTIRSITAIFHGNPSATNIARTARERFRNSPLRQRTMLVCKSCPSCVPIAFSHSVLARDCSGTNRKDSTRDRLRRNRIDL